MGLQPTNGLLVGHKTDRADWALSVKGETTCHLGEGEALLPRPRYSPRGWTLFEVGVLMIKQQEVTG